MRGVAGPGHQRGGERRQGRRAGGDSLWSASKTRGLASGAAQRSRNPPEVTLGSRVTGGDLRPSGQSGSQFFTSLYMQGVLGLSPTKAGLAFVPMALAMALFAGIGGPVAARFGAHRTVAFGLVLVAAGVYLVSLLGRTATFADLMPGFLLIGIGSGLNVPLTDALLRTMPPERSGIASAAFNASREVAGLLGITIIGAVLRARQSVSLHAGATPTVAYLHGYQARSEE